MDTTYTNRINMPYAPTDPADLYPETDGEPMEGSQRLPPRNPYMAYTRTAGIFRRHAGDLCLR